MPRANSTIVSCAEFSDDGQYRYSLTRTIQGAECRTLLFVLLNPSCADAVLNDATVMHCQNIAFQVGNHPQFGPFGGFRVCNLFARVGTVANLRDLDLQAQTSEPRDSQRNDVAIRTACDWADDVVCGWGGQLPAAGRRRDVIGMLRSSGKPLWCLGVGSNGDPYHPSRGQENRPIEPYRPDPALGRGHHHRR